RPDHDYYGWKLSKGESYDPLTSHSIHLEEVLAVAKHQGVKFEVGDILLIRSGYTDTYYKFAAADPARLDDAGSLHPCLAGVAQTEEMKAWLHDNYFSAVAGDAPAWECWPPKEWALVRRSDQRLSNRADKILLIAGVPAWFLGRSDRRDALAKQCEQEKRWSFFFMSTALNMPGGVASLANSVTIH
ncbi:unnamed protein product, partial [Aureobasidium pullulans]